MGKDDRIMGAGAVNKAGKIIVFAVLSFVLGCCAGAVVWAILRIMHLMTGLLWDVIPEALGTGDRLAYYLFVCIAGGIIIGMWQRKYGIFPDELEVVMARLKTDGFYPYDKLHILAVSALLPLIFGGALGPEAGLTGLIAGMCCFIGDKLKYKGDQVAALAEAGMAAVVGVVFNAPLFGIADNLEHRRNEKTPRKRLVSKPVRTLIYVMGVAGGMLAMKGLGALLGSGMGLPRFSARNEFDLTQWKWTLLFMAAGIVFALFYIAVDIITAKIGKLLEKRRITSCVIAGIAVALMGYYLPLTMFSGEDEMGELMTAWEGYSPFILILSSVGKLFLVNFCINLGWKGGKIFPIIFSGVALGYAMAMVVGADGTFAVAVTVAAMYGYIMRKPLTTATILLLCFPITYIIPVLAAAFLASLVPAPGGRKRMELE